jgi:hypothetical protein
MSLEQGKKKDGISRRGLIGGAIAAAAAGAAGIYLAEHEQTAKKETGHEAMPAFKFLDNAARPESYPAGALEGRKVGHLYADYLGLDEKGAVIGPELSVDFKHQLAHLWRRKLAAFATPGDSPEQARLALLVSYESHPELFRLAERLYDSYDPREGLCNVRDYQEGVDSAIAPVRRDIEALLERGHERLDLSRQQAQLVASAARRIDGKDLTAISLAELMPTADGTLNRELFDFLLCHAGEGFIDRIPAIHDSLISFGPYQLTRLALDGSAGSGASALDALLPRRYLPQTIEALGQAQHHQAAYLFAIHNIIKAVRKMDSAHVDMLERHLARHPQDLFMLTAVSHNKPSQGRLALGKLAVALLALERKEYEAAAHIARDETILHVSHSRHERAHEAREIDELRKAEHRLESHLPTLSEMLDNGASIKYARRAAADYAAL